MTSLDDTVSKISICRNIIDEINNFGISNQQRITLIHMLALEIEDNDLMKEITNITKTKKLSTAVNDSNKTKLIDM